MTLVYDEKRLVKRLEELPGMRVTAFAASCAQRLLPAYGAIARGAAEGASDALSVVLERVWSSVSSDGMDNEDATELLEDTMSLLPAEPEQWSSKALLAEDAVIAVAYTLRSITNPDRAQEAGWAARKAYEAVDQYALLERDETIVSSQVEQLVLQHPLVQRELEEQQNTMRLLETMENRAPASVMEQLRQRSIANAHHMLDGVIRGVGRKTG